MKFLTTIIGILPVLCVVAPCYAALQQAQTQRTNGRDDSRISVSPSVGVASASNIAAARRLPTLRVTGSTTSSSTSSTTTTSALMEEVECVERYTECIKASDVCDFNFEECTTKELFYAKKPQCNSVLLQCTSAGINTLFGTTDLTQLSVTNADLYPSAGSIVGQFIDAGAISNRLDTSSCVKRYTSCLKKDNVCGEDFELCTTNSEFKKQKIYCESTLARCQEEGVKELFGLTDTTRDPTSQSRLGVMISEGAGLAAVNAVSTCYKVADQCVLSACSANPYRCMEGSSTLLSATVDAINESRTLTNEQMQLVAEALTKQQVSKYIKNACFDTIGGNKYCHMTVNEGKMPSAKALIDEDERDNVYADIIGPTMKRVDTQLQKILDKFDKKAKDTCSDTITACAMRSCGSGIGSLCYSRVFGSGNSASDFENSINGAATYNEIKTGCESIVNSDANCQYAAASATAKNYNYSYNEETTFTNLFPADSGKDPIGVITRLNASLAQNYNNAAIEKMAKDCKNTAVSCIRSMCGSEFTKCYRNRNDVMSDAYDTGNARFDNSMNKAGGVLDFNIVRGLCVAMVKGYDRCEEHLKIQSYRHYQDGNGSEGWGDSKTVRDAWVDAAKGYKQTGQATTDVLMGCTVRPSNTAGGGLMGRGGESICDSKAGNLNLYEDCGYVDEDGCIYDQEYYMTETDYQFSMTVDSLFREVLADLEMEAQQLYNSKLTEEQNMCRSANSGGIMGNREASSTYMWVKLRSKRVPKNYSTAGLKVTDFTESNDLYGSFCRARVTIQSDDPDIQAILQKKSQNWSTAYFAVGDVFTCGSWIPQKSLEQIANRVACKKAKSEGKLASNYDCTNETKVDDLKLTNGQSWAVAGTAILSTGLGAGVMEALQSNTALGGLLNTSRSKLNDCQMGVQSAIDEAKGWLTYAQKKQCSYTTVTVTKNGEDTETKTTTQDGIAGIEGQALVGSDVIYRSNFGQSVIRKKIKSDPNGCVTPDDIQLYISELESAQSNICDKNSKASWATRIGADVLGAAAVAIPTTFAVRDAIREGNRTKFTEAEEEFMRNVGEHIYCFIGADEAGTYGDLIEISVE